MSTLQNNRFINRAFFLTAALSLALDLGSTSSLFAQSAPEEPIPTVLQLDFAAVYGAREPGEVPAKSGALGGELEERLEDWDLSGDLDELKQLFKLAELEEISRWSSTVPANRGSVEIRVSDRWRLELETQLTSPDKVEIKVRLFENEKLAAAPRLITLFGDRVALSTESEDGYMLFLFAEVNPLD